jgi:hypothetical protein
MAVEIVRGLEIGAEKAGGGLLKTLAKFAKVAAPAVAVAVGIYVAYKFATRNKNKSS